MVVTGDAGIGKTTLVADLARPRRGAGVQCRRRSLPRHRGRHLASHPVVEAVSSLSRRGHRTSGPVPRRGGCGRCSTPTTPRSSEQPHLLDDLRLTVLEAAACGPVLLVLEDLHWADASTRDLAITLSRTARGRLLLVLTVRTDDLHRRHPARKALAEISRVPGRPACRRRPAGPGQHRRHRGGGRRVPRPIRRGSLRSWTGRRATRSTPRSSSPPGRGPFPEQLADLFLAAGRRLARRCPGGWRGWPPWTGRGWTSARWPSSPVSTACSWTPPARAARRPRPAPSRGLARVLAPAAARGRVRRPPARRAHPAARGAGYDPPGARGRRPRAAVCPC